jgi:hypothetical protein
MVNLLRKYPFWLVIGFLFLVHEGQAWGIDADIHLRSSAITQKEFKDFSKEAGLAISYIPAAPAEPLGIIGFDIGIEATVADIREDRSYWRKVTSDPPTVLVLPKLHAQKGLPFGFDIGLVYSKVPQSNVSMIGGEIKWAYIAGNTALPAIALRGSYTRLLGVGELNLDTFGADLSISKGLAFVTPYAGYGQVWVRSKEKAGLGLEQESLSLPKPFIGVKISLLLINLVLEADFSEIPLYTGRLNIGF